MSSPPPQPTPDEAPTEVSPLLGDPAIGQNGVVAPNYKANGAGEESVPNGDAENQDDDDPLLVGMPEVRLGAIIPALAIGVSQLREWVNNLSQ